MNIIKRVVLLCVAVAACVPSGVAQKAADPKPEVAKAASPTPAPTPPPAATASPTSSTTPAAAPAAAKPAKAAPKGVPPLPPEKAQPVRIPRFETAPVIDGKLDEAVWKTGAVFKDFYQFH